MKSVNQSRCRFLDLTPFFVVLLLCGLMQSSPLEASLFDPERGALADQDQPVANSGSPLNELRLDGILTVGDHRRVLISGTDGVTYRFNWHGAIEKPMTFEGELADRLVGYKLSSADARSVWLQLPPDAGCKPDPKNGIAACEEGRAKLAIVYRSVALESPPTPASNAGVNRLQHAPVPESPQQNPRQSTNNQTQNRSVELQISRAQDPAWIRRQQENQRVINSGPAGYFGYVSSSAQQTSTQEASTQQTSTQQTSSNNNTTVASSPEQQTPPPPPPPAYTLDPAWIQMEEENQRLIDSAPPGYFGVP